MTTRIRNAFIIFTPSRRRIEFLQKNIRQLKVEFIDTNVFDQRLNNKTLRMTALLGSKRTNGGAPDARRKAEYIICGQEQTKKQATAKEHVEIFLRFEICLFLFPSTDVAELGATLSSARIDFASFNIL